MFDKFWAWYEKHYVVNISASLVLFALQIFHLYWLTAHVVATRLVGKSFYAPTGVMEWIIIVVDYTEIPALLAVSLIYIHELRQKFTWKSVIFLIFLNSQWLHLFWITDEFVQTKLVGGPAMTVLPLWLAWVAIGIDYLELPVIADTVKKLYIALKTGSKIKLS